MDETRKTKTKNRGQTWSLEGRGAYAHHQGRSVQEPLVCLVQHLLVC